MLEYMALTAEVLLCCLQTPRKRGFLVDAGVGSAVQNIPPTPLAVRNEKTQESFRLARINRVALFSEKGSLNERRIRVGKRKG